MKYIELKNYHFLDSLRRNFKITRFVQRWNISIDVERKYSWCLIASAFINFLPDIWIFNVYISSNLTFLQNFKIPSSRTSIKLRKILQKVQSPSRKSPKYLQDTGYDVEAQNSQPLAMLMNFCIIHQFWSHEA